MAVALVARAGLEHGPADHVVGARRLLVDQELHLHVDPAVVALQALDLRHVAQVGAVHLRRRASSRICPSCLSPLCQRRPTFHLRRHDCPPAAGRRLDARRRNRRWSMPSPRQAFIISLAAAASGTGLPSLRPRSSARIMSFCCSVTSASGTVRHLAFEDEGPAIAEHRRGRDAFQDRIDRDLALHAALFGQRDGFAEADHLDHQQQVDRDLHLAGEAVGADVRHLRSDREQHGLGASRTRPRRRRPSPRPCPARPSPGCRRSASRA